MAFLIDATTHISPNHSARKNATPTAIVLHSGEGASAASDLAWLKKAQGEKSVSCHYYVTRTGIIYQLVPDWREAWHAGISEYLGYVGWGDFSLGIETEHKQGQNWPEIQRAALAWLCKLLITKYDIRQSMVVAHRWIAPGRKHDPSDWSDAGLTAWIKELYAGPDYAALWGNHYAYFESSGIAAAWRDYAAALGQCVSDETGDAHGRVWRLFAMGAISYDPVSGKTVVYVPRTK